MNLLEEYTNFAVVIDDMPAEASRLRIELKKAGIHSVYMNPNRNLGSNDIKASQRIPNTSLIFLDLFMNPHSNELNGHISFLRGILESLIGNTTDSYGIILWTKNSEHFSEFLAKIEEDRDTYSLPSFVFMLKKEDYWNGYDSLIDDINKGLEANFAAKFAVIWDLSVRKAKNVTIRNFYSLLPYSSEIQSTNLKFLFYKLAESQNGLKHQDLTDMSLFNKEILNSFSALMTDTLSSQKLLVPIFEKPEEEIEYQGRGKVTSKYSFVLSKEKCQALNGNHTTTIPMQECGQLVEEINGIITRLNTMLFLEDCKDSLTTIMPGNIFTVNEDSNMLNIKSTIPSNVAEPNEIIPVAINMNPPCDFVMHKQEGGNKKDERKQANNISHYRLLGGAIITQSISENSFKKQYYYRLKNAITYNDKDATLIFDFRYIGLEVRSVLEDSKCKKYKLIYRAKKGLFADILQKMTSHAARLGVGAITPIKGP